LDIPVFHVLVREWICLMVKSQQDANLLLDRAWKWGRSELCSKNWKPGFDPRREPTFLKQIWVLLPRLPLELWNSKIVERVGNTLGQFIALEDIFN
jgi:hypothetical protein